MVITLDGFFYPILTQILDSFSIHDFQILKELPDVSESAEI